MAAGNSMGLRAVLPEHFQVRTLFYVPLMPTRLELHCGKEI